ncbi:FAD-dependent oxidoreductase [Agrobacterium sp.]|uniref:NAD(P)/FAD-dependent oxidoreductase n=1 Tax=Agrobacterium sp. TaxID=361 RepID=UPI0028ABC55D|nr:FAD-dependent oxidoreductase [Agrobacterium sp.]
MTDFKYIIIGAGMMGSAAARHLSQMTDGVALIGPAEPADRKNHRGVFASHYDEARITRGFDGDRIWGTLAVRSLARYAEIEAASGIPFYSEVGCLFTGEAPVSDASYVSRALTNSAKLGLQIQAIKPDAVPERFPMFALPSEHHGYFEARNAGYVNPRALVRAQVVIAEKQGVTVLRQTATRVRNDAGHVLVETADGNSYTADKVLVAAGGFTNMAEILPRPVDMAATGRTIVFFELDEAKQALFKGMPSTIVLADNDDDVVYILPPVRYPDGKVYLKIGGEGEKGALSSLNEAVSWFQSDGSLGEVDYLTKRALSLMPDLAGAPVTSGSCVASITKTGYPYIGYTDAPNIAVLTGGNFVAAKSSDEIGRLGAQLLFDGALQEREFAAAMNPVFI